MAREQVIEAAEKYLFHGLVEHDPAKVPLAPACWRTEQGQDTGASGSAIAEALRHDVMKVITGISDLQWIADGEQAVAFYTLHVTTGAPVRIAERFRVVGGAITEIEAIFTPPPGGWSADDLKG